MYVGVEFAYFACILHEEEHDKLRAHVWTCHMSSLHAARPLYQALLEPLPLDERRFCEGWTCFVDLLAAARRCHVGSTGWGPPVISVFINHYKPY